VPFAAKFTAQMLTLFREYSAKKYWSKLISNLNKSRSKYKWYHIHDQATYLLMYSHIFYSALKCFGHSCDQHQSVLYKEYNKLTNYLQKCAIKPLGVTFHLL
jgi:hypothetical protein